MGLFFEPYRDDACCLCASTADLTGEHKIKASALRAEFGSAQMVIGNSNDGERPLRLAQGPKSKSFHFSAKLCGTCNGARTQAADREFDHFNQLARTAFEAGEEPANVLLSDRYAKNSEPYLNLFRYFAKLLCCHFAESEGPLPLPLASFAMGQSNKNCVFLSINPDWTYQKLSAEYGEMQYAAHGGLVVYGNKTFGHATGFHSTLTIGPLQYVFFCRLYWPAQVELMLSHRKFNTFCRSKVREALRRPIPDTDQYALGLAAETTPPSDS